MIVARREVWLEIKDGRLWNPHWHKPDPRRPEEDAAPPVTTLLREVASKLDISFHTLYLLVNDKARAMSWRTLLSLKRHLRPAELLALRHAVDATPILRLLREYAAYIERESERFNWKRRSSDGWIWAGLQVSEQSLRKVFNNDVERYGLPAPRAQLGVLRVYDCLVGWRRLRSELTPGVRLRLVRQGWARERALLKSEFKLLRKMIGREQVKDRLNKKNGKNG